jgi:hypothetical protein
LQSPYSSFWGFRKDVPATSVVDVRRVAAEHVSAAAGVVAVVAHRFKAPHHSAAQADNK